MTYAGDVTPRQAHEAVMASPDAHLVDVRTAAEWNFVGLPDLSADGREVLRVEWSRFPDGSLNPAFIAELRAAGVVFGHSLYFLCRSGVRSAAAAHAATEAGLGPSYNILEGFEGPHDEDGHRSVSGWKNSGLPWKQG